ncbi:MAG: PKD domain-containing protein [Bacteroidia bacterium]|nr:PKD domain-containing protein [Bacteroidia bacterium]MCZ2276431.1 PKD domain-containing protein [Bacteroidia bacterium]
MKQVLPVFSCIFLSTSLGLAQCPQVTINVPDTLCLDEAAILTSTTVNAIDFEWDFCPGDLRTSPIGTNIGNPGGLSFPSQIKVIKDNGNYYAFIASYAGGKISRVNFGNSLTNTPTVFNYTGFTYPTGIDLIKEGSNWIGLVTDNANNKLFKLDFGFDISANSFSITDLGVFTFNQPRSVKIAVDSGNYYAFVTNYLGSSIHEFSFGSSLNNTPTVSLITNPIFLYTWGFDLVHDCSSGEFIAFVSLSLANKVVVLNFGNSLANPANVVHNFSSSSGNLAPVNLAYDADGWHLFILNNSNSKLQQHYLGYNLLNPSPALLFDSTAGSMNSPRGISMIKEGSAWYAIICNQGNNTLSVLKFENPCNAQPAFSYLEDPPPVVFNDSLWNPFVYSAVSPSGTFHVQSDSIFFAPYPQADFSHSAICLNLLASFNDQSAITAGSITGWQWDFGDGSPFSGTSAPQHSYSTLATNTVTLVVTSEAGCADTISKVITVNELPQSAFSFIDNQCRGTQVLFNDLSVPPVNDTIAAWEWDFGDGSPVSNDQHPVHSFASAGSFTVKLTAYTNNGCPDSSSQIITIVPGPLTDFSFTSTCSGDQVSFTNLSSLQGGGPLTYEWDFGDGNQSSIENPQHTYPTGSANYQVGLIATSLNGCKDTLITSLHISEKAIPSFTFFPSIACINSNIQFSNTSIISPGDSIVSVSWDFGDTTPAQPGDNVVHQYSLPGIYQVTLFVKTYSDCDTSLSSLVTVIDSPVADFSFQNACIDSAIVFTDQSVAPSGSSIDSINWNFGDGNFATGNSVSHQYLSPGNYTVTITVFTNTGCTNSIDKQVIVYPKPLASWVSSFPCVGSAINFFNTSSVPSGNIAGYLWNFGDGTFSVQQTPQHTYNSNGPYEVALIVYSAFGCTDTSSDNLIINSSPEFDFSISPTCLGQSTQFSYINLNSNQSDTAFFWNWNFGDNTPSSIIPSPSHFYAQPGVYQVTLTATALNTCSRIVTKHISVNPVPQVSFTTSSSICIGSSNQFTNLSYILSGSISQFTWNFGDNSQLSNDQHPVHTYYSASTFNVTLTAISDSGCTHSASQPVTVSPLPEASYTVTPDFGSPPLTVTIVNSTPGLNSYSWNFGDGSALVTDPNPLHTYSDTGSFTISLIVTNSSGCTDTLSKPVVVLFPNLDLAITSVNAVSTPDELKLSAVIRNKGNVMVSKFEYRAYTDRNSAINESWQGTVPLKPGENLVLPLNSRFVTIPGYNPGYYCLEILSVNQFQDADSSNNRMCATLDDTFGNLHINPSPVFNNAVLIFTVPSRGSVDICLYEVSGKLIYCQPNVEVLKGYNETMLSTASLAKGMYTITVQYNDELKTVRMIKQ